jgi:4-azaleucine resistance transporter AzlC
MTENKLTLPTIRSRGFDSELVRGAKAALPVLLGFIPFALVLGAQASHKGLSAYEVALMTGLNFGGGSEFAAIELWSSPPQALVIVAMTLLVNSRHLLMGAALAPYLQHLPLKKALLSLFFMCDESWAMGLADAKRREEELGFPSFSLVYFVGVSLCLWLTWVMFTLLGAVMGAVLGDLHSYGFDMAFAAVFLVLLRGMWRGVQAAVPWLFSLVTGATFYLLIPGGWYVLAGTVAGLVAAYLWAKS